MIRKTVFLSVAAAVAFSAVSALASINWHSEPFADLLKEAKAQNKPIFIDFYTTWCGPCKMLDSSTYPNADVQKLLSSMLPAKYDAEKDPWVAVAKEYKIHAYPTMVVIAPDGKEVDRWIGYLPPEQFVDKIGAMARGTSVISTMEQQLQKTPDDFDLLVSVGTKQAEAGNVDQADEVLKRAMAQDPKNEHGKYPEILLALGDVNYGAGRYPEAKKWLEQLAKDFPNSEEYTTGMSRLAATEYKMGNQDAAVATYWAITKDHMDDYKALNGFAWFCSQRKIGLDKALPVALRAAELSKRDPGILDTLAEIYYARGDFDKAIKVETEAAAHDPSDTYFKDQIEKYRKAKAGAEEAHS